MAPSPLDLESEFCRVPNPSVHPDRKPPSFLEFTLKFRIKSKFTFDPEIWSRGPAA